MDVRSKMKSLKKRAFFCRVIFKIKIKIDQNIIIYALTRHYTFWGIKIKPQTRELS